MVFKAESATKEFVADAGQDATVTLSGFDHTTVVALVNAPEGIASEVLLSSLERYGTMHQYRDCTYGGNYKAILNGNKQFRMTIKSNILSSPFDGQIKWTGKNLHPVWRDRALRPGVYKSSM